MHPKYNFQNLYNYLKITTNMLLQLDKLDTMLTAESPNFSKPFAPNPLSTNDFIVEMILS